MVRAQMGSGQRLLPFPCYLGASSECVLKFLCSFCLLASSPFLSIYNLFFFLHFCSSPIRAIWCDQHIGSLKTILVPSCHLSCFPFNLAHGNQYESIIYTLSLVCENCLLGANSSRLYLVRWGLFTANALSNASKNARHTQLDCKMAPRHIWTCWKTWW